MVRFILLLPFLALIACGDIQNGDITGRQTLTKLSLPPAKSFTPRSYALPRQTNAELARDFLELSFQMESGRRLPTFTRFEGPITVRMTGNHTGGFAQSDLDDLIGRLRKEARLDITRVGADEPASITVQAVSRKALQRIVPQAACFVVPNARSWEDFRRMRHSKNLDWARLETRTHAAIFLPGDVAPQEIRDCLHEELAQALGPLNDLYRLSGSVFNDDNFHTVLTGFDMLMLRVTYSPHLKSGMTKGQVAAQLPRILSAMNPGGGNQGIAPQIETPREWIDAVESALGPGTRDQRRLAAAKKALSIAETRGWTDNRMAFSLFIMARMSLTQGSELALGNFFRAATIYGASDTTALHAAHVGMQLAAYALSSGDPQATIGIVNVHLPEVARAQNAALLSTLLLLKAEALSMMGNEADASIVREDGLSWARYGFGSATEVGNRLSEIASLRPLRPTGEFGS